MDDVNHADAAPETGRASKRQIFETLRHRICILEYEPGSRLNERELAQEFGVSRTPLRAVLQKLEKDGLITIRHGHGTFVAPIDLGAMRDIYVIRMHLMDAVAESSPLEIRHGTLDRLDALMARCRALKTSRDKQEFAGIIIRLHEILHNLVSNPMLREFNDALFFQSARFWFLLLKDVDFDRQAEEMLQEITMLRRSLELEDIRLTASIHKTHLGLVLAHLDRAR